MGKLRWPLEGDIAAAALEKPVWGDQLSTDLIHRVVKFESKFVSGASLLHCWAARDRSGAFFTASQMGLEDVVCATDKKDKYGSTPLDCALRTGSSGIAKQLLVAGSQPTKLYIIEDCGVKLAEILKTFMPSDPYRRSEEAFRIKTPSQAAAEGDLATLETYDVRGEDFNKVDDQGKTPLQHAVEQEQSCVWPILGVHSCNKNDGAFAAVRVDGSVVTWGTPGAGGDCSKVKAQLTVDVRSIYSTRGAFAALKADGSVVAWGDEDEGGDCSEVQHQLVDVRSIYSTTSAFAALKADGSVVAWGAGPNTKDQYERPGFMDSGGDCSKVQDQVTVDVQSIYSTTSAFAALKADGSVVTRSVCSTKPCDTVQN